MGYSTDFYGEFDITPPLTPEHREYLEAFAVIRHMKRDELKAALLKDDRRKAVGLPIGPEGAYYVGSADDGNHGQSGDESVVSHNDPPGEPEYTGGTEGFKNGAWAQHQQDVEQARRNGAVPGLWCQWVPSKDGTVLKWDEGEKFYNYVEWLKYLMDNFFTPWGYTVTGMVEWQGEDNDDRGRMVLAGADNKVQIQTATITWS